MSGDVLVCGETLIDLVPERPGPLADVERFERRPGGAPANVAVGLARLDRPPLFWTRVGGDSFGHFLERTLADEEIPADYVERDPAAKTTLAVLTRDERGDRSFSFYRDGTADTRLDPGTVPDSVLDDLAWVHAGGVTLSAGRSREATLDLLARASPRDCVVSFDPNYRPELWPDEAAFARVTRTALRGVDVCKATSAELDVLGFAGDSPTARARAVLEWTADAAESRASEAGETVVGLGPHTVFVTRGAAGAVAVADERSPWPGEATHDGFDVDAVDATGAGDAFVAGAIDALLDGHDLETALSVANAVGAAATTATGGMAALPSPETVRSIRRGGTGAPSEESADEPS